MRGVAGVHDLEQLGLICALADDIGLGKTLHVIARLIGKNDEDNNVLPTLLNAPTSVVGNWAKEIKKSSSTLTDRTSSRITRTAAGVPSPRVCLDLIS